jgi:hypothetical protein
MHPANVSACSAKQIIDTQVAGLVLSSRILLIV